MRVEEAAREAGLDMTIVVVGNFAEFALSSM